MILLIVLTIFVIVDGVQPGDPVSIMLLGLAILEIIAEMHLFG